ncbi:MAG: SUMF1/EgtB/PvdO family nonheme iron enzyme [Planctomycetota bacterium]
MAAVVAVTVAVSDAQAEVVIETVTVGNPGNAGELSGEGAGGQGPDRICGAVDYVYNIGKFEVTAEQYTEFLNAVAATDTYGLYNPDMWTHSRGCKIERTGSSGSYSYSVAVDWADRPVNYVPWGDAARFANWLHNGQPTGAQDLTTTEDGSYYLDGASNSNVELAAVVREPDATWVIPSEDEWYKAAYHKNDGVTGNYWDYPMGSSAVPDNGDPGGDTGNSANFYDASGYRIGSPYWRTEVGYFGLSGSPYGTFDQGGNVWEWNEADIFGDGSYRGVRGGSFLDTYVGYLHAAGRNYDPPSLEYSIFGFRVAELCPLPPPPAQVTAEDSGVGGSVNVSWQANAPEYLVTGYRISFGQQSGSLDGEQLVGANVTGYQVTGLENYVEYFFSVAAINDCGEGDPLGEVSATPTQPSGDYLKALMEVALAVKHLVHARDLGIDYTDCIELAVGEAQCGAQNFIAYQEDQYGSGNQDIVKAWEAYNEGVAERNAGRLCKAVKQFRLSWAHADQAE